MDIDGTPEQIDIEIDLPPGQEPEEGSLDRRRINTPSRQGSNIPTGWKPTVNKPIPVLRCSYVWPDQHARGGDRCNRWSLRGSRLCYTHSGRGNLRNLEEYRQAVIESARLELIESAPSAVTVLLDLMANSLADNVRLKAAESVLDRTGLKAAEELNVHVEVGEMNPAAVLAERMAKLKKAADLSAEMQRRNDAAQEETLALTAVPVSPIDIDETDIVEGEIVDPTAAPTEGADDRR